MGSPRVFRGLPGAGERVQEALCAVIIHSNEAEKQLKQQWRCCCYFPEDNDEHAKFSIWRLPSPPSLPPFFAFASGSQITVNKQVAEECATESLSSSFLPRREGSNK